MRATTDRAGASAVGATPGIAPGIAPRAAIGLAVVAIGALTAVALVAACPGPSRDILNDPDAPPAVQTACRVMVHKCSRCHDPERFSVYRPDNPRRVKTLVDRMRRMQGSNITPSEGDTITDCLVFHNFGNEGLQTLHGKDPDAEAAAPEAAGDRGDAEAGGDTAGGQDTPDAEGGRDDSDE